MLLAGCTTASTLFADHDDKAAVRYATTGDLKTEVDSLAKPLIESGETPGIMVGVLTPDGQTHFYSYGVADKTTGAPPDPDTLYAVGSLSKGFLGDVTAMLVDQGELSWDDTLGELLPPDAPISADAKKITLLQLATHTSGLPREPDTFQTFRYFLQYQFTGVNFYRHFDADFTLHYLTDFEAPKKPEVRYSNIGYGLLGYAIEQHTGKSLDELLTELVTGPLGLTSTGYDPEVLGSHPDRARGYAGDEPQFIRRGQPTPDFQFPELMKGSAAVYSDARDLLKYAAANLSQDDSRLTRVLEDNLKPRVTDVYDQPAIAWFVDEVQGEEITYQEGLVAGYSSYVGLDRRHHVAVVVLENSFNWDFRVGLPLLIRMAKAREIIAARESQPPTTVTTNQ